MIRRLQFALSLSLLLAASGCKGTENVMGTPNVTPAARTLASMMPYLTKSLTPPSAELAFGSPDNKAGSGLVLYIYNVESDQKVNLAFPGPTATISYASLQAKDGTITPITLKD